MRRLAIDAFLREHYQKRGGKWCAEELGVGLSSVYHRAAALGLKADKTTIWSDKDRETLAWLWENKTISVIRKKLGLKYTARQIYNQAWRQGLGRGCPRGLEYLSAAATRTGYSPAQLRQVLRWSGVQILRAKVRPGFKAKGGKHTHHVVDPVRVDAAVAEWLHTEPAQHVAKRFGVSTSALIAAVIRLGLDQGLKERPKKAWWRLPPAVAEAAGEEAKRSVLAWRSARARAS